MVVFFLGLEFGKWIDLKYLRYKPKWRRGEQEGSGHPTSPLFLLRLMTGFLSHSGRQQQRADHKDQHHHQGNHVS